MPKDKNISEKLNNHHLPVDESYWAEMEERLQYKRKKVVPLWWWFAGAGVAASLALLFTFTGTQISIPESTQMTQIEQISTDIDFSEIMQIFANNIENEQVVEMQIANNTFHKNPRKSVQSVSSACQKDQEKTEETAAITQAEQDTTPNKQYTLKPNYGELLTAQNNSEIPKTQHKKSWQLAAAVSSGASNASNNNLAFLDNSNKNFSGGDSDRWFNDFAPPENSMAVVDGENKTPSLDEIYQHFPEVTHAPPLSVGLTVRKNLNKHLAIETGLTYTFLQSRFKDHREDQWQRRDATLKLHYLGVPVNMVAYLVNQPQWNVYFSLGGMVEKGIMLDYVQRTRNQYPSHWWWVVDENQPVHTVSLQDDIPELQWSLNTSFGIGYKFYRDISIYFEPRIIYYFKNNQPVSARTEMPLLVGLNAGLRFEF